MSTLRILALSLAAASCVFLDFCFFSLYLRYCVPLDNYLRASAYLENAASLAETMEQSANTGTARSGSVAFILTPLNAGFLPEKGMPDIAAAVYNPSRGEISFVLHPSKTGIRSMESVSLSGFKSAAFNRFGDALDFTASTGGSVFNSTFLVDQQVCAAAAQTQVFR